jgi:hypothetical protein
MRKMLAVLILGAAVALSGVTAFAGGNTPPPFFFGDGFDNTTCADQPRPLVCR